MKCCTFFIHVLIAAIVMNLTTCDTYEKILFCIFNLFFAKSYFLFECIISVWRHPIY